MSALAIEELMKSIKNMQSQAAKSFTEQTQTAVEMMSLLVSQLSNASPSVLTTPILESKTKVSTDNDNKVRLASDVEDQEQPVPKRRKSVKKAKKDELHIINRDGMPAINKEVMMNSLSEINTMLEEKNFSGWTITYQEGDADASLDLKCQAIVQAKLILKSKRNLLMEDSLEKCSSKSINNELRAIWFTCCAIAFIVAFEKERVSSTVPHEEDDFLVTPDNIPKDTTEKPEQAEPTKASSKGTKVRTSKNNNFSTWQKLARSNPSSAQLLAKYKFPIDHQILCSRWKALTTQTDSEQCKRLTTYLSAYVPIEEWQRNLEILYVKYESMLEEAIKTENKSTPEAE